MTQWRTIEHNPSLALRAGSVRLSRRFQASPERIFDAWLNAEQARTFLFARRTGDAVSSEIDARVGGRFRIVRRGDSDAIEYCGEYLEIDRPYRLAFSLSVEKFAQLDDRVVLELASVAGESLLVLTHEHSLPTHAERHRIQGAWETVLGELAAWCVGSAARMTLPQRKAPVFARWDTDFAW